MGCQTQLLHIVRATHPIGGLTDFLNRRDQQSDKDSDDGNNHQQFDEREGGPKMC
jgi:hypothetical protein